MDLRELINNDSATVIDVREVYEFDGGHVEGAINIPLGQVADKLEEFAAMSKPLILCCASGNRSGQATAFLNAQGIEDAFNGGSWYQVHEVKMQNA